MSEYACYPKEDLLALKGELLEKYEGCRSKNLKLDMSRGKPAGDQLDLSLPMLGCLADGESYRAENGTDCRNYGLAGGLPEAKALFAGLLGVEPAEVIVGGNSSLNMMYDTISQAFTHGLPGGEKPWAKLEKVKFLCPSPGYDRHFGVCDYFGIEMIPVEMKRDGPDMDAVARLVERDEAVKGIWCVPKYSNPEGITYSDGVVDHFAQLRPAAGDFRIYWDNAYAVHHLSDRHDRLKDILAACRENGREDMVFVFGSTSKISFPGAGVAAMAASKANLDCIRKRIAFQTIGPDKLNQLRHVRFFKDLKGIEEHMQKHARLLRPKFDAVVEGFERELGGTGLAEWTNPNGGYFISVNVLDGCAKRTVELCGGAGVKLTPAGATYPYGKDPRDRNIRIAPTYPPIDELKEAVELFCLCVKLASVEKLLGGQAKHRKQMAYA